MHVKITPTSKRAKNRTSEHGEIMILVKEDYFHGIMAILVGCIGSNSHPKCAWTGWLTKNECSWELLNE